MSEFYDNSLEEIETAVEQAQSFDQLINNLRNVQQREGNHRQIFEQHINDILRALGEIRDGCQDGVPFDSMRYTRFNELPDSLVKEKAVELANEYYDEEYAYRDGRIEEI